MRLSSNLLKDRVDLVDRGQYVTGQDVAAAEDACRARDVPCAIATRRSNAIMTALGIQQKLDVAVVFAGDPGVDERDVIRVARSRATYVVQSVEKYPSPARVDFTVVGCILNQSTAPTEKAP